MGSGESDELLQNLLLVEVEVPGNNVFFVTATLLVELWCLPEGCTPCVSGGSVDLRSVQNIEQLLPRGGVCVGLCAPDRYRGVVVRCLAIHCRDPRDRCCWRYYTDTSDDRYRLRLLLNVGDGPSSGDCPDHSVSGGWCRARRW